MQDINAIVSNLPAHVQRKVEVLQHRGDTLKKRGKHAPASTFSRSKIQRDSPDLNIHINDAMSPEIVRQLIDFEIEKDGETVNLTHTLSKNGLPPDYLCAFNVACEIALGSVAAGGTKGALCEDPPMYVNLVTGEGESRTVAIGRIVSPLLGKEDKNYIEIKVNMPIDVKQRPSVSVTGSVQRRAMGVVVGIIELTEEIVRYCSIYKGKAIKMSYEYADRDRLSSGYYQYNVEIDAPEFIRTGHITLEDVILNDAIKAALAPIEVACLYRDILEDQNIPTSGSALLAGPPGTGKTMYSSALAYACTQHGVTFMHVHDPTKLALALRDAVIYAPCVVFCEDIDRVVGATRTVNVDDILNRMDGVDTKDKAVNCIFTTNHVDQISSPALRPGRMDAVVPFQYPDAKSTVRFLMHYNRGAFTPDFDYEKAANTLANNSPAVLDCVVTNAKKIAVLKQMREGIARHHVDIRGKVTTDDVLAAFSAMEAHISLLNEQIDRQNKKEESDTIKAARVIAERLPDFPSIEQRLTTLLDQMEDITDNLDASGGGEQIRVL